jgi:HNH endonuclease
MAKQAKHILDKVTTACFWSRVDKGNGSKTNCWIWIKKFKVRSVRETGGRAEWSREKARGYGKFSYRGRTEKAHRVAWRIAYGPIPDGMHVCHRCDNPACVNYHHLFLGTDKDNLADMEAKGRKKAWGFLYCKGEAHPQVKLTEKKVREIRALHAKGIRSKQVAERYGVTPTSVRHIVRRATWAHVR